MRREEQYHLLHFTTWHGKLANAPGEAHARYVAALERAWPDALDLFAPIDGEDELLAEGVLSQPFAALREQWEAGIRPLLEQAGARVPEVIPFSDARRGGLHPDFAWLWNEMTMVYRSEPGAVW
jgi:ring-1,2-phenylacetyl-CoA epoxidase subunit PaaC